MIRASIGRFHLTKEGSSTRLSIEPPKESNSPAPYTTSLSEDELWDLKKAIEGYNTLT